MSETHTISMPEEIWEQVFTHAKENNISNSSVFQSAIKKYLTEEKKYRFVDVAIFSMLTVIIILLMVVIL